MAEQNPILRSIELIEAHITERLTVKGIAENMYFSRFHSSRLFRECVGGGIMEYIAGRKLTLAGEELLSSRKSILEIALAFGYRSHESFARAFKAYILI